MVFGVDIRPRHNVLYFIDPRLYFSIPEDGGTGVGVVVSHRYRWGGGR